MDGGLCFNTLKDEMSSYCIADVFLQNPSHWPWPGHALFLLESKPQRVHSGLSRTFLTS